MSESMEKLETQVVHKWTVELSRMTKEKTGEYLTSPVIVLSEKQHGVLCLYPKGDTEKSQNYMSVFFKSVKGDWDAKFQISILDNRGRIISSQITNQKLFEADRPGWGFGKFIEYKCLTTQNLITHSTDSRHETLTFMIEVIMTGLNVKENESSTLERDARLKEFDDFENLIDNEEFSDAILTIKDKKLHVHKCILASKSPIFKAMFTDKREGEKVCLNMEDVDCDAMKELMRFVYTGKVDNLDEIAEKLFVLADTYSINGLRNKCEQHLLGSITQENVIERLNLGCSRDAAHLKNRSLAFFKSNVKSVVARPDFKLSNLDKSVLDEIQNAIVNSWEN